MGAYFQQRCKKRVLTYPFVSGGLSRTNWSIGLAILLWPRCYPWYIWPENSSCGHPARCLEGFDTFIKSRRSISRKLLDFRTPEISANYDISSPRRLSRDIVNRWAKSRTWCTYYLLTSIWYVNIKWRILSQDIKESGRSGGPVLICERFVKPRGQSLTEIL